MANVPIIKAIPLLTTKLVNIHLKSSKQRSPALYKAVHTQQNNEGRKLEKVRKTLKRIKKTYLTLQPEIKIFTCAKEYLMNKVPVDNVNDLKKSKHNLRRQRRDGLIKYTKNSKKKYIDFLTIIKIFHNTIYNLLYKMDPRWTQLLYAEKSIIFELVNVVGYLQRNYELLIDDKLFQCSKSYIVERFRLWIDS